MSLFGISKIIAPDFNNEASFTLDCEGHFFKTGYGITLKNESLLKTSYVLGILNSSLLFTYLKSISTSLRGGYVRFWKQYLEKLPIRTIDFSDPADVARHDRMVALVEQMLDLNKRLAAAKAPHEREVLAGMIDATDRQIDKLVYELYGLTEDEVAVVEGTV